ncbi:MAG: hypothetical protein ABFC96_12260 [Thermoguttaceae bacterium]
MKYEIVYGDHALDRLFAVASELDAPELVDAVEEAMDRLADDPLHHGKRGRTIYQLPGGRVVRAQEFDFHCNAGPGRGVHFRAHFYFGDDELSLRVINLTANPYLRL